MNNSRSKRDKVISYLHQCKQCGLLFERIRKGAASNLGEFSWDRNLEYVKLDVKVEDDGFYRTHQYIYFRIS